MRFRIISCLFFISALSSCQFFHQTLFEQLPANETGIAFANRITENDTMNILDFEYVYNGGGVGLGDFNNDGLQDVFFSGNQVSNRLYLNKGAMKFEDITQKAGIGNNGKWCSGVSVVDINNDGFLDVYVCATASKVAQKRENLLFVNQGVKNGVPIFKEMAKEYGVADDGHSTNSAFFDYDNDGDLDLYVLTNTIEKYPNAYRIKVRDGSSATTDRLYRNDYNADFKHGVFTNVSKEAGILIEGYGLGLNICDINRDGWKDIYVTNDYLTDDLLYINNQNGTFTDQAARYFKHTSNSAMGNDVVDMNNDGLADIIAVDMQPRDNVRKKTLGGPNNYQTYLNNDQYGYTYQYVRNTLQLNQGFVPSADPRKAEVKFSDIGLYANVAETDWSWTPSAVDFDNDGLRDLIVTNGFPRDVTDRDFMSFRMQSGTIASKEFTLGQLPVIKISNYAFRNKTENGNVIFEDVTKDWGMNIPSFSNGAVYGDLDNDGDLDYVVNNINDSAFVFKNNLREQKPDESNFLRIKFKGNLQNTNGLGAIVEIKYQTADTKTPTVQLYEHSPFRGYLSTVEAFAHFGLGKTATVDEVKISWPNGKQQTLKNVKSNQVLLVDMSHAKENTFIAKPSNVPKFVDITDSMRINYVHQENEFIDFNAQKLLPHKFSQYAPGVAVGDVNGDGLDDVFVGGSVQRKGVFFLQNQKGFQRADLLPETDTLKKEAEDMGLLLFDADGDGDNDLYVASGGVERPANHVSYQDRLYLNDGKGHFSLDSQALPPETVSGSCVKAADYDHDGDLDLFVGGRVEPGAYPKPVSSRILRNESPPAPRGGVKSPPVPGGGVNKKPPLGAGGLFTDVTAQIAPQLQNIGLICDALWTDTDNDGWPDLMLAGELMPLAVLKNDNGKKMTLVEVGLTSQVGFWNSLTAGDFDNDGDIDYVAGNVGPNGLLHANDQEPITVYAKDFNNDGLYDAIPMVYFPDQKGERKLVPFHGRDDVMKQFIQTRARFLLYHDFANATPTTLFKPEELKDALILKANELRSVYVENLGKNQFALRPLPMAAQLSCVFGMTTADTDNDGNLDVIMVGNDFGNELTAGRYDAFNGLVLKGDGKGNFVSENYAQTGFLVSGNAKGLATLRDVRGNELLVATQNRGTLRLFKPKASLKAVKLSSRDAYATIYFKNGKTRREEFYFGHSFLSQSGRWLSVGKDVKRVEVIETNGKKRIL